MSAIVTKFVGKKVIGYLEAQLDPDKRKWLDGQIIEHMLSEIPRVKRLIEERIDQLEASGCSPYEANIIAHQVIEEEKRTFDEEKRRRLSNVLVNGFCVEYWNKARHRLMVRLASQLEEEHIDRLLREAPTPEYRERRELERKAYSELPPNERSKVDERESELEPVRRAIERELISLGLLAERTEQVPNSRWKEPPLPKVNRDGTLVRERRSTLSRREPEFVDKITVRISRLGRQFLEHLRDPEAAASTNETASPVTAADVNQ